MMSTTPNAARLTAPGRGAVATVRVTGSPDVVEAAGFRPASGGPLAERSVDRIVYGYWGTGTVEDVVVCRTSETTAEIHCHGGAAAVARIEADLRRAGCAIIAATEDLSTFDRELLEAVTRATTVRTATLALAQYNGALRAAIEAAIDAAVGGDSAACLARLDDLLSWSGVGLHLATPWRVVLTGRPNVGKSSLVNALLGFGRAIVYDEPGTTRDVVTGETAFAGWPVTLADTAGLRETGDELESAGIARARETLATADLRIVLVDASVPGTAEDERLLAEWPSALVVAHKSDRPVVWSPPGALAVSSLTGAGVDELIEAIVARLVPVAPEPTRALPVSVRQRDALVEARSLVVNESLAEGVARLREIVE